MPAAIQDITEALNEEERGQLQKLLSHPLHIPDEFKSWFADWFATNVPKLPVSQVFGFKLDRLRFDEVSTSESTASTSYTDLTTAGPQLTKLANGYYLLIFGCGIAPGASDTGFMSISLNGVTASDNDSCSLKGAGGANDSTVIRALVVRLTNNDVNSIVTKYRVSAGTHSFMERYLYAIKVIDLDVN